MPGRTYQLHGRVQGVGFRWWARSQADRLGVRGSIRNDPDGSVVVVAVADAATLDAFRALLEQGPTGARVDRVEEADGPTVDHTAFTITH
jgi:acylphosphatase